MNNISVKMFGDPIIKYNEIEVNFPYKKSEGLFYYVCINKKVSREEAINIFWADCDEKTARKNLRDAIYKIKKTLTKDIFIPSKSSIEINHELTIVIDTDNLIFSNELNIYKGDFLGNFNIKNCYEFENWVSEKRNEFKKIYIKSIEKKVNELVSIGDFKGIETYSKILIEDDPYNEKTYRYLMKLFALFGNYNKAIKLYYDLSKILRDDLDIEPEAKTKKMFQEILKLKDISTDNDNLKVYFFGRYSELYVINKNLNNFYKDSSNSILITGEAGIGKTAILDKITKSFDMNKNIILKSLCYSAEEEFFLKPWHSIFSSLGHYVNSEKINLLPLNIQIISYIFPSFNKNVNIKIDNINQIDITKYELMVDAILNLLEKITEKKKVIIIFDDIQWMDKISILLLSNIITHFKNNKVLFIGTYRDDYENKMSSFTVPLIKRDLILKIKLNRFSFDEVKVIISQLVPKITHDEKLIKEIYDDTDGNALFLIELLNIIKTRGYTKDLSSKAINIIKSRLLDLTKDEKALLNIISIFFDKASIDWLKVLVPFDELYIFDIIESLQEKKLIQEIITENDIFYSFTHQKIREYIYDNQSLGKKLMLHEKIGTYLEDCFKLTGNKHLYPNLIYHFNKSGNLYKSLKYKVENLTDFYTIYHETYPVFSTNSFYFTETRDKFDVEGKLLEILSELNSLNSLDTQYLRIKMELSYLSGRYYISVGEYEKGLENIDCSMRNAEILECNNFLLNNYKQMIFYCIQVNNIPIMYKYINKSLILLEKNDNIEERGTILRLKGLYYIKIKKFENATKCLNDSIDIFLNLNKINNKYTLNISACYNYLGQMNKDLGNYDLAYDYFNKSINLCKNNSITKGLEIFYSNIGQVLYYLGRFKEAQNYINKSLDLYNEYKILWGRDIAECYASLLNIKENNLNDAFFHYKFANELSIKLNNPISIKLSEKIKNLLDI